MVFLSRRLVLRLAIKPELQNVIQCFFGIGNVIAKMEPMDILVVVRTNYNLLTRQSDHIKFIVKVVTKNQFYKNNFYSEHGRIYENCYQQSIG